MNKILSALFNFLWNCSVSPPTWPSSGWLKRGEEPDEGRDRVRKRGRDRGQLVVKSGGEGVRRRDWDKDKEVKGYGLHF